jgi:hypothetical protein
VRTLPKEVTHGNSNFGRGCRTVFGLVIEAGFILAACGGPNAAKTASTPLAAAQSWFKSINDKNLQAAQAHFVVSEKQMMDWGGGDPSTWPTFTHLRCKTLSASASKGDVYCTFNESAAPAEGNPDSFWSISLQRSGHGPWLINNYGQG